MRLVETKPIVWQAHMDPVVPPYATISHTCFAMDTGTTTAGLSWAQNMPMPRGKNHSNEPNAADVTAGRGTSYHLSSGTSFLFSITTRDSSDKEFKNDESLALLQPMVLMRRLIRLCLSGHDLQVYSSSQTLNRSVCISSGILIDRHNLEDKKHPPSQCYLLNHGLVIQQFQPSLQRHFSQPLPNNSNNVAGRAWS